jgi:hypothetical protein
LGELLLFCLPRLFFGLALFFGDAFLISFFLEFERNLANPRSDAGERETIVEE